MTQQQKKSVLGRGLNALIPKGPRIESKGEESGPVDLGKVASIEISKVRPNPFQPRTDFDESALDELKRSIQEKGVIQPVTVRRVADGYQIIAGERRLRAAQMARMKEIPAYVLDVPSDEDMLELALIENIQREHLNPMEVATAYQRLLDECHLTQEDVAQKVGKDRTTVTNFLRLLKLPAKIQDGLRKNKISMGHARALVNLPNEKVQLRIFEKIVSEGLSVRKVEDLARGAGTPKASSGTRKVRDTGTTPAGIQSVEEQLRQTLGTKVMVRTKGGGRGEIIVEFYSLDEFDRLLELFSSTAKYR
ncbi:MAG: ParB/RepB/Spo0J family partition protein [Bacteroidetes bacterium]|jgi:ParB family chromosome partitioning protein|nr:ParB/RepB/Spo0J family partition protein [Bacteroidota bacterium]